MLDTLDFTVSELWALFNFPYSTTLAFCHLDQKMSSRHHGEHHKPQTVGNKTSHIKFHHRTTDQSAVILKLVPPQERALKIRIKKHSHWKRGMYGGYHYNLREKKGV